MSAVAAPPLWALPDTRRLVLQKLANEDMLEPTLWHLVFDATSAGTAYDRDGAKNTWQIDWSKTPVSYAFAPQPDAVVSVDALTIIRAAQRHFSVQRDGFLCGTHALNTLARAVVVNPCSTLETIATMRVGVSATQTIDLFAQREELIVTALKEGVVLASVLLNNYAHFTACDDRTTELADQDRCLEMAARAAGGLMLLFSSGGGFGGHYVCVVPMPNGGWALYDTDRITRIKQKFGEILSHACQSRMQTGDSEVVGLVPLAQGVSRTIDLWYLSTLRNMSAVRSARGVSVDVPILTPINLHAASAQLRDVPLSADELNWFTFYAARNRFESEMNDVAEELARGLIHIDARGEYALLWDEPLTGDDGNTLSALIRLASLLRTWIGILFCRSSVLANRDWLRYVAIHYAARRLRVYFERYNRSIVFYRLVAAVAAIAVTWHKNAGESGDQIRQRYSNLDALFRIAKRRGVAAVFGSVSPTTTFGQRSLVDMRAEEYESYYIARNRFDRALWLMYAIDFGGFGMHYIASALPHLDMGRRENGQPGDDMIPALDSMRDVAFTAPPFRACVAVQASVAKECAHVVDPNERQRSMVQRRRAHMAPRFRDILSRLTGPSQRLLSAFGFSPAYVNNVDNNDDIDRDADHYPHLIEQALVQQSGETMYGSAFDTDYERPEPNAGVSARFVSVDDRYSLSEDAFASYVPFTAIADCNKRKSEETPVPVNRKIAKKLLPTGEMVQLTPGTGEFEQ